VFGEKGEMAENWEVIIDQKGYGVRKIYYNKLTGQTTLEKPDHLKTLGELQRVSIDRVAAPEDIFTSCSFH
jgi:hypothetical protein